MHRDDVQALLDRWLEPARFRDAGENGLQVEGRDDVARVVRVAGHQDAAQALGASWHGRPLGTFGHMAALSFHETKNVISGEGGALLISTSARTPKPKVSLSPRPSTRCSRRAAAPPLRRRRLRAAPAGLPKDVVAKLNGAFNKALQDKLKPENQEVTDGLSS